MKLFPALVLLGLPLVSAAAEDDVTENIVVTGTRTPRLLDSSPVKVDVVKAEDIARLSQGTLRQVLEVMPGVVVTRSTKDGYNVQLQGFNADHVLILIDGQPMIAPTGSAVDLDQISASNIQQIEIVRGAASVLYGSAAMGGVINIITAQSDKSMLKADYELSSYLDNAIDGDEVGHLMRLQGQEMIGDWKIRGNVQWIDNPGYDYNPNSISQNGAATDKTFVDVNIATKLAGLDIISTTRWFKEDKSKAVSAVPGQSSDISYLSSVKQWQQDLRVERKHNWHLNGRFVAHDETSGNSNSLRDTDIQLFEIEAQKVWMANKQEWVAGTVIHNDNLDQIKLDSLVAEVDNATRSSFEAYAQGNFQLHNWHWLAGSRVQHDTDFGWHHALRASASSDLKTESLDWQWRAGLGQSYRVPNLKERYYVFDHSNLGYMVLGNEDLQPETATSGNLGIALKWQSVGSLWQIKSDINLHYANAKRFITTVNDAVASSEAGLVVYVYENIESATLAGADLSLQADNDVWKYEVNYSYLHAVDGNDQRLPERPRHLLKLSMTRQIPDWQASIQVYSVYQNDVAPSTSYSEVYEPDSFTLNSVYQQQLNNQLSWRLSLENWFDSHQNTTQTQAGNFDARGLSSRKVSLGLSYTF